MHFSRRLLTTVLIAASVPCAANTLRPGVSLELNQGIRSPAGRYTLTMQGDRALVVRRWDGTARWVAPATGLRATMHHDGLFALHGAFGVTWHTMTYNMPGYMAMQDDGNLVHYRHDGRATWNIGADNYTPVDPRDPGDVVGRDLDVPGLGAIGHIGIWDGSMVAEVVAGASNAARFIKISDFKAATRFWGVARPSIPRGLINEMCFYTYCNLYDDRHWQRIEARAAVQKRARQIQALGADYTLVPGNTRFAVARRNLMAAVRGLYRCDTFVLDIIDHTRATGFHNPRNLQQQKWSDHVASIQSGVKLPSVVYNRLAAFR